MNDLDFNRPRILFCTRCTNPFEDDAGNALWARSIHEEIEDWIGKKKKFEAETRKIAVEMIGKGMIFNGITKYLSKCGNRNADLDSLIYLSCHPNESPSGRVRGGKVFLRR